MSEMGQELKSWLKAECQGVGLDLIDAVVSVSGAVEDAFDLSIPGKTISAAEMLEISLKHTIGAIAVIPIEYLTAEERRVIFDLEEEIKASISKLRYPTNSIKESADIIQKKALRLQSFIQKYLLEKVVECQCGKPGESSSKEENSEGGNPLVKDLSNEQLADEFILLQETILSGITDPFTLARQRATLKRLHDELKSRLGEDGTNEFIALRRIEAIKE